jgi:hypothetical protein
MFKMQRVKIRMKMPTIRTLEVKIQLFYTRIITFHQICHVGRFIFIVPAAPAINIKPLPNLLFMDERCKRKKTI